MLSVELISDLTAVESAGTEACRVLVAPTQVWVFSVGAAQLSLVHCRRTVRRILPLYGSGSDSASTVHGLRRGLAFC